MKKKYTTLFNKDEVPTIRGGGRNSLTEKHCWDMIKVKSATKDGFEEANEGDSINLSLPNSTTRRGRVGKEQAQTLDTQCNQAVIEKLVVNEQEIKGNSNSVLSKLRKEVGEEKIAEWGFRILNSFQEKEVLQSQMYGGGVLEKAKEDQSKLGNCTLSCEEIQEKLLREMWQEKEFGCSSYKWGLARQFFREFTNALQGLPYQIACNKKDLYDLQVASLLQRILYEALSKMEEIWQSQNNKREPIYATNIRRLTEIEVEVLQGYPPDWTKCGIYEKQVWINKKQGTFEIVFEKQLIPKTQRYKLCGNAVTKDVVELIARKLLED